jgi:hypothetical protein
VTPVYPLRTRDRRHDSLYATPCFG